MSKIVEDLYKVAGGLADIGGAGLTLGLAFKAGRRALEKVQPVWRGRFGLSSGRHARPLPAFKPVRLVRAALLAAMVVSPLLGLVGGTCDQPVASDFIGFPPLVTSEGDMANAVLLGSECEQQP